ncbi:hypothetical protein M427DRAFT_208234 [Gonapodya prolifera JEL478]|uniref:Cation efflux protein transmembrane domain-containing protein n=1 Tax=Gonapodya prolifera (strain JEL478) TaxID=1344416 RepID=A0A139ANK0_GONPJ|nr:hypothetical protein M427DRAFT_208234 [Gonapodya prolifera JEL478]|eukprot:KXS18331.1 hypothetical protein M427DRAFT_208234 [Gonapodya prolifera JEL478]
MRPPGLHTSHFAGIDGRCFFPVGQTMVTGKRRWLPNSFLQISTHLGQRSHHLGKSQFGVRNFTSLPSSIQLESLKYRKQRTTDLIQSKGHRHVIWHDIQPSAVYPNTPGSKRWRKANEVDPRHTFSGKRSSALPPDQGDINTSYRSPESIPLRYTDLDVSVPESSERPDAGAAANFDDESMESAEETAQRVRQWIEKERDEHQDIYEERPINYQQYDEWIGEWKSKRRQSGRDQLHDGNRVKREVGLKGSLRVVVLASTSNFMLLVAKTVAAFYTGSASMFSEAIHSSADLLNELLLAFGIWRSMQEPDPQHPYGFAAERYGWALVSGVGIFFLGGGVSLLHGIQGILSGGEVLTDPYIARMILGGALLFDGATLVYAFRTIWKSAKKAGVNVFDYIRRGADPTTVQVFFEDIGSVTGVAIAFTCLSLAEWTGDSRWDSLGSFLIGCLLAAIASFLIRRNVAGIVGASMQPSRLNKVVSVLKRDPVVT